MVPKFRHAHLGEGHTGSGLPGSSSMRKHDLVEADLLSDLPTFDPFKQSIFLEYSGFHMIKSKAQPSSKSSFEMFILYCPEHAVSK